MGGEADRNPGLWDSRVLALSGGHELCDGESVLCSPNWMMGDSANLMSGTSALLLAPAKPAHSDVIPGGVGLQKPVTGANFPGFLLLGSTLEELVADYVKR